MKLNIVINKYGTSCTSLTMDVSLYVLCTTQEYLLYIVTLFRNNQEEDKHSKAIEKSNILISSWRSQDSTGK